MFDFMDDFMDDLGFGEDDAGFGEAADEGTYSYAEDTDGDGYAETLVEETYSDMNDDGVIDTVTTNVYVDTDLDGLTDYNESTTGMDLDGDGAIDSAITVVDADGDGQADETSVEVFGVDDDDMEDTDTEIPADTDSDDIPEVNTYDGYENFDPSTADMDSVVGDPASSMDSWHVQESDDTCAVVSQEFVLEDLTGEEFEEEDLVAIAEENGWYNEGGGTPMEDVGNILEYMGLDVEKSSGNDISDIEECLESGGEVIVGLDSDELWYGDDDVYDAGEGANHAVEVIGIDYSDPDNPMVILNDSGTDDGCGALVPLDQFMDAWEDSDCYMVEAYSA